VLELTKTSFEYPVVQLMDFRDSYRNFALWNRGNEELAKKMGVIINNSGCYFIHTCVVQSDGNVLLCCQDGQGQNVMGSLVTNSLQEIWESSKFREIRGQVSRGTFTLPICKRCGYQALF
jgi:8-amino-3,8-dideoxy-alpha-D-manno-octulosonate transaminase